MVGIYVHIPFCASRCHYCDFYSTTALNRRTAYVQALKQEIALRRDEWKEGVRTIYFGGGTPSQLKAEDIADLIKRIDAKQAEEITVEMNPCDVTLDYLQTLHTAGVNRLSMGIQSFHNERLQLIGRRHNAEQAIRAVSIAREAGIANLSLDLMYGLPGQTMDEWEEDIDQLLALHPEHISTYCLQWEEGTQLTTMMEKGIVEPVDEEIEMAMYDRLTDRAATARYEHYEVSNYALEGYRSKHNSSYWHDVPYIGLGAAAHSYDRQIRRWNVSDLEQYIAIMADATQTGVIKYDFERLNNTERHNEYIMLSLRTKEGIELSKLRNIKAIEQYLSEGLLEQENGYIRATQRGLHILNRIIENIIT